MSPEDTVNADVNNSGMIQRKNKKKGEEGKRVCAVVTEKPREQKEKKRVYVITPRKTSIVASNMPYYLTN